MSNNSCGKTSPSEKEIVIYRLPKVMEITGLCRSHIYSKIAAGEFINPIRLGRRSIGFRSDELQEWILSRPRAEIKAADKKAAA